MKDKIFGFLYLLGNSVMRAVCIALILMWAVLVPYLYFTSNHSLAEWFIPLVYGCSFVSIMKCLRDLLNDDFGENDDEFPKV
jgi:hypothetical protein|nr:MAG TPA: hypothetical protein [Caudoviricetes sp.]